MKVVCFLMLGLFLYSVAVQYNDPDPIQWMAIYLGAAIFSTVTPFRRVPPSLLLGYAAVSLIWAATIAPLVIGKQSLIDSEEGREMLGLTLVTVWLSILALWVRLRSPESARSKAV